MLSMSLVEFSTDLLKKLKLLKKLTDEELTSVRNQVDIT